MYSTRTQIICIKLLFPINKLKNEEPICALVIKHRNEPAQLLSRVLSLPGRINQNTLHPYLTGLMAEQLVLAHSKTVQLYSHK